jgi:DNA (cytosine-5)-methyltransferase 1
LNGGNPACNQGGMAVVSRAVSLGCGDVSATLTASMGNGITETTQDKQIICIEGNGQRESHKGNGYKESDIMYTLNTVEQHAVACETKYTEEPYNATTGSFMMFGNSGVAETLMARDYKDPQIVSYGVDCYNQSQSKETVKAITSAATDADHIPCTYNNTSVVRRLTPMECERLQGYPDHWTDIGDWVDSKGKKHKGESDSPRYKALGNSIALPFWQWMAERMVRLIKNDEPEKEPTMASLFDGIGGFPLVYSRCGCKPVWCSEIEEFPIAVTKVRFPERKT